jgi:AbiV family abortive infection protein
MEINQELLDVRARCLKQADGFIEAADILSAEKFAHIVHHLSLLALEEVGKASMLGARSIKQPTRDDSWFDRWLGDHRSKLQWAVWSPMTRLNPEDFSAAREFAERAHKMRLASLYVDADPDSTDKVTAEDARLVLSLARDRLELENAAQGLSARDHPEIGELTQWFFDAMDDPQRVAFLLGKTSAEQYERLKGDARAWVSWARDEIARLDVEAEKLIQIELARPGAGPQSAKPRWRANATVFTPSHSLRSKALAKWNDRIEAVKLLWTGRKDELTLQITIHDNLPMTVLFGRLTTLAKLTVACINIGTIGYFWFQRAGFEQKMFKDIRDLEINRPLEITAKESFWEDGRSVPLTDDHINNALGCMLTFAPLSEADAEPIFSPYFNGLAMIAKSDTFYRFDHLARHEFIKSLAGAFRRYGDWDGSHDTFEQAFHRNFTPFMPDQEHRVQMLRSLTVQGDPSETSLVNLRSAKQIADLFLVHTAKLNVKSILSSVAAADGAG